MGFIDDYDKHLVHGLHCSQTRSTVDLEMLTRCQCREFSTLISQASAR
jgi:hypothetical protein